MLGSAMLMGVLAVLGLPDLVTGARADTHEDEDEPPGRDASAALDPPEAGGAAEDDMLPAVEESNEFYAGGVPGSWLIEDFRPGEDVLNLRVPGDVDEVLIHRADAETPASLSYTWEDETIEVRFAGLETVPVDDVLVWIDGDGEGIPLGALVAEDDGDVRPGNDAWPSSQPGDSGGDDDADALPPNDPSLPSGGEADPVLAALMQRDGADPTGQVDSIGSAESTGSGDDVVALPDDGIAGTGEGSATLVEAAVATGGDAVDLGAGNDTLVAGDAALHGFGGDGDDDLTAGEGAAALYGGAGDDALTGTTAGTGLLHGGSGDDTITGGSGDEYLDGGEHAEAEAEGNDTIDGGAGDDTIRGGWGSDSLSGGSGDDVIDHHGIDEQRTIAEEWHDDWTEEGAPDTLDGGGGDDVLILGSEDLATGGEGADVFWLYPEDAGSAPAVITDFEPGEDFLRITIDPASAGEVTMDVAEDGIDVLVMIGGEVVAVLENGVGADLTDVYVEVKADVFPTGGATAA